MAHDGEEPQHPAPGARHPKPDRRDEVDHGEIDDRRLVARRAGLEGPVGAQMPRITAQALRPLMIQRIARIRMNQVRTTPQRRPPLSGGLS